MTGQQQAMADGIYFTRSNGWIEYHVPCEVCGRIILTRQYSHSKNYLCPICKAKVNGQYVEKKLLQLDPKIFADDFEHANRFNKAVKYLSKKYHFDISESINKARVMQNSYGSVPESIAAIEMIRLGYTIVPQQRIGRYTVDFLLYNERIVVEIDGKRYHQDQNYERDKEILDDLGILWRIVHITDEEIYNDLGIIQRKLSI